MKKQYLIAIAVIFMLGVLFFTRSIPVDYYNDNYSKMSKYASEEVTTIKELRTILDENSTVYVYVGRPSCGDSDEFEEYFIDMMKEDDIDNLVYFNINDIVKEHDFSADYKYVLDEEFGVESTPTLAKFEDGELVLKSEWTMQGGYNKEMAEKFIEESGIND